MASYCKSARLARLARQVGTATLPVFARDLDGLYRESPLHDWFEHLASGKGLCCSFADGYAVQDADWDTIGGRYRSGSA
jgi:hypothetical protein